MLADTLALLGMIGAVILLDRVVCHVLHRRADALEHEDAARDATVEDEIRQLEEAIGQLRAAVNGLAEPPAVAADPQEPSTFYVTCITDRTLILNVFLTSDERLAQLEDLLESSRESVFLGHLGQLPGAAALPSVYRGTVSKPLRRRSARQGGGSR